MIYYLHKKKSLQFYYFVLSWELKELVPSGFYLVPQILQIYFGLIGVQINFEGLDWAIKDRFLKDKFREHQDERSKERDNVLLQGQWAEQFC